ncbi:MAG: hypothetical protein BWY27_01434 [Bacteroidetes bacterium ADurb.Bin234]|nr:MAG: hypothetical protein BWY27_01434 [Bacteroidetes bacterium ADurb.Bin234]
MVVIIEVNSIQISIRNGITVNSDVFTIPAIKINTIISSIYNIINDADIANSKGVCSFINTHIVVGC